MMGIVSVMGLFSACDVLEDAYDDPSVEKKEGQYYVDATDYAQWVYINLHTPTPTITTSTISLDDMSETGAPSEWDIAHHRYDVKTNGAAVVMTPYHTIEDLEMAGMPQECQWVADEYSDECVTVDMSHMMEGYLVYAPGYKNTELGKWVNVDTSNMPPNYAMYDNVMLIRFADSTYAAIQLVNFMSTDRYQIKGWMTVNYQYPVF
ncbi:HmuY family protein [Prevotella sp. E2-28]|uniref:HmuY family protein n=1 Tax=Prevotella sp. E2-28 TaxID=2913620 RepID=UPI001EDC2EEF|nr:HmuY family protein [Prevotella sp. E2-28]UKK52356.1 HmuY family protein [Prevotella sp. E2-28]